MSLPDVYSVKKYGLLRDFVIDIIIDIFAMSETWQYHDNSAIICVLTALGNFAVVNYAVRKFRCKEIRRRKFRRTIISPYGNFAIKQVCGSEVSPYENFVVCVSELHLIRSLY